jgi:hypothetical protein
MDVVIVKIGNEVAVLDIGQRRDGDVAIYIEKVAELAHEPVEWALVEVADNSDFGAGDIADQLTGERDELPTASLKTQNPEVG